MYAISYIIAQTIFIKDTCQFIAINLTYKCVDRMLPQFKLQIYWHDNELNMVDYCAMIHEQD